MHRQFGLQLADSLVCYDQLAMLGGRQTGRGRMRLPAIEKRAV
jgi:hypothetical protein